MHAFESPLEVGFVHGRPCPAPSQYSATGGQVPPSPLRARMWRRARDPREIGAQPYRYEDHPAITWLAQPRGIQSAVENA